MSCSLACTRATPGSLLLPKFSCMEDFVLPTYQPTYLFTKPTRGMDNWQLLSAS